MSDTIETGDKPMEVFRHEDVKSYWYWLGTTMKSVVSLHKDWIAVFSFLYEAVIDFGYLLGKALGASILRIVFLLTAPVSVPLLAWLARKLNRQTVKDREMAKRRLLAELQRTTYVGPDILVKGPDER